MNSSLTCWLSVCRFISTFLWISQISLCYWSLASSHCGWKISHGISILWNLLSLFYDLTSGLSWRKFHVFLGWMCILLLLGGVDYMHVPPSMSPIDSVQLVLCIQFDNLWLLIGLFSPCIVNVIIDMIGFVSTVLLFVLYMSLFSPLSLFYYLFVVALFYFAFMCELSEYFLMLYFHLFNDSSFLHGFSKVCHIYFNFSECTSDLYLNLFCCDI